MQSWIGAFAGIGLLMLGSQAAQASAWCYRDFGTAQTSRCTFSTFQACAALAAVRQGGTCERADSVAEATEPAKPKAARKPVQR